MNEVKTVLDIGIGINSIMEVLIPKNSCLPYEFECELSMNDQTVISLYEGNRFYVMDNLNIGNYNIYFKNNVLFKLIMNKDYTLKVYINDDKIDTIQCFQTIVSIENEILEKENELRELKEYKNEYSEFIQSSLISINELDNINSIEKEYLIDRLHWAKQVLSIEDVSSDEYKIALHEIEGIVNPIFSKYINKPFL